MDPAFAGVTWKETQGREILSMPRPLRIACALGAALALAGALAGGTAADSDTAPAMQQLIVKFKAGAGGERVASQAMQDQARQPALFAELAASLSREVGMPVTIAAVTSGRELVMAVDAPAAVAAAIAAVTKRPDVVRATRLESGGAAPVVPVDPVIEVEFAADSATAASLAEGVAATRRLGEDLSRATGLPLVPRAPRAPIVQFTLEIGTLTTELAERLKQRGDVAYVQPVDLLQPLPQ